MKILWLSPLAEQTGRPNYWRPLTQERSEQQGGFPNVWLTTTANVDLFPTPFAVGLAEVTPGQRNVINNDAAIASASGEFLFGDAPPPVEIFADLSIAQQGKFFEWCDRLNSPRPLGGETVRSIFDRLIAVISPLESVNSLVNMLAQQWGI